MADSKENYLLDLGSERVKYLFQVDNHVSYHQVHYLFLNNLLISDSLLIFTSWGSSNCYKCGFFKPIPSHSMMHSFSSGICCTLNFAWKKKKKKKTFKILIKKQNSTVKPVLSSHPQGVVGWPLNTSSTVNRYCLPIVSLEELWPFDSLEWLESQCCLQYHAWITQYGHKNKEMIPN